MKSPFYEIMRKNIVDPDGLELTIWRMRITRWNLRLQTHTQNMYLLIFPLEQRLYERASTLRYTYIACLIVM
jgi:hypothetical protein